MKLYYWPKTRAFRALWMLEELDVPYELAFVDLRADEQKTDAFRALNPMMKLPVLEDGPAIVADSAAILLYLADKHSQSGLAPAVDDPQRARFLQWLFFASASLEPAMAERFSGAKTNPMSFGWGDFGRVTEVMQEALAKGPWIMGERFTIADILLANSTRIAIAAKLWEDKPPFADYLKRISQRPAYKRAQEIDHGHAARLS